MDPDLQDILENFRRQIMRDVRHMIESMMSNDESEKLIQGQYRGISGTILTDMTTDPYINDPYTEEPEAGGGGDNQTGPVVSE